VLRSPVDPTALSPSERLRVKVELAAPALGGTSLILLGHARARHLVPRFLGVGYHIARAAVPLMETAHARARELADDPVARGLEPYLERHILEEMHSEEPGGAVLADLEELGVDPAELRAGPPPPKLAALIGDQYHSILHRHPVAVLGFLELERFHARQSTVERLIEITGLPRAGFRQLLLHAELDVDHAEELDRLLDALPLEPWHERLIAESALHTISALAEVLLDVIDDTDAVSPKPADQNAAA
jgi:hypothetical protein